MMKERTRTRLVNRRRSGALAEACRVILPLVTLCLGVSLMARADDFWKHKPPAQWSSLEALKLLRRSPWTKVAVVIFMRRDAEADFSVPTGTRHCDPDAINANGDCMQKGRVEAPIDSSRQSDAAPVITPSAAILVRWESAKPVAQAFARLQELGDHAAAEFQAPTPRLPADQFVITLKLEQPGRAGFEPFVVTTAGKPALHATLRTRQGTVSPLAVEFTGTGTNSSVHFFFPRALDGAPLLGPARDSADFNVQGAGFALHARFTLDLEFIQ